MLSVLIPIYNQDVRKLVSDLALQCQKEGIHYQILCFDDGSKEKYLKINRAIETIYGVSYIEFQENVGRSRIRNKLGFNAMYDHLLFLDCDSKVDTKRYIKNYLNVLKSHDVVYGGTIYSKRAPRSQKKILHWRYGQLRERLPLDKRISSPWQSFRSNNFLIKRDVFLLNQFDEKIVGYGHEDTLFAQHLKANNIQIHHIHNPVRHGGLETVDVFLQKVEESVVNLVKLQSRGIKIETALTTYANKIEALKMTAVFEWFYQQLESVIQVRLRGKKPSMLWLDVYKLNIYIKAIKKADPKAGF